MRTAILILSAFLGFPFSQVSGQDTLRIAAYNILNYGNSANPYPYKNQRLAPILQAIQPSLVCFNEVSTAQPGMLDTLLGVMPFPSAHGPIHNTVGTTQLDGLFWRTDKFRLLRDTIICSDVRDIVAYEVYWDYPGLPTNQDTVKLTVITAHLKSSNSAADRVTRAGETQKLSAYLAWLNQKANYLMLGDFNFYTSSEIGYQNLIAPSNPNARLNDPLNRPGAWDNNASFADVHTQSPRFATLSDGGAGSGLDSRFDFILVSDAMLSGEKGIKYIPGSYTAFGNDGQHFSKAITDAPVNSAVSPQLAQALLEVSDHLPVYASFSFTPLHQIPVAIPTQPLKRINVVNPITERITLLITPGAGPLSYQLFSIDGRLIKMGNLPAGSNEIETNISSGIYILSLKNVSGDLAVYRVVRH